MIRMISGYTVRVVFEDQKVSHHGPFFTEDRARKYVENGGMGIVDYTIEPLVIPHGVHLRYEEK